MIGIRTAAALGFLGVALGAFGAHYLKARVDASLLAVYQTGVLYHLVHALALLALALYGRSSGQSVQAVGACFLAGVALFSGSLYALAFTGIRAFGAITPLGGLAFLAGWALLFFRLR